MNKKFAREIREKWGNKNKSFWFSTKEEIDHDLLRYQVAERVPAKNGDELLVMKTFPSFSPTDKAYWIDGSVFYKWINSANDKRPHKDHQTIAFAKAYVQQ
jgi:hypothetical protein